MEMIRNFCERDIEQMRPPRWPEKNGERINPGYQMERPGKSALCPANKNFFRNVPLSVSNTWQSTEFQIQHLLELGGDRLGPRQIVSLNCALGVCAHKRSKFRSGRGTLYT